MMKTEINSSRAMDHRLSSLAQALRKKEQTKKNAPRANATSSDPIEIIILCGSLTEEAKGG